jgi:hypothetical protein
VGGGVIRKDRVNLPLSSLKGQGHDIKKGLKVHGFIGLDQEMVCYLFIIFDSCPFIIILD